jgi:tRNA A-37 threonylcarbamoyl transferase component Bud32
MARSRFPPSGRYQLSDRYRLDSWIAAGGVGEVWRAVDTVLDRAVAIKLLREEYVQDDQARARFRAEARHAGALSHPGIAQIYDYAESDPDIPPFLVMELVEGPSLAAVVAEGPLDPCRTMDVVAQTAAGLEAAHRAGLIHRDIKPANLLLTPAGQVKITDFGIAYAAGSAPLTRTGLLVGTPAYLAPERAMGASATAASDLYSLGIVAFECLTGTAPFTGVPLEVATAHRHRPLPPLPATVPPPVAALVQALTSKDPTARPSSAGQLADRAGQLRDSLPPSPPAPRPAAASPAVGGPTDPPEVFVDPADPLATRAPSPLAAPISPAEAPPASHSRLLADTGDSPLIGSPPGGLAAAWADDPLGAYGADAASASPASPATATRPATTAPPAPVAYARSSRFAPSEPSRYSGRHASPGPVRPADTLAYGEPAGSGATETLLPGSPPLPPSPSGPRPPVPLGPRGLIAAALAAVVLIAAVAIWLFSGSHGGTPTTHSNSPRPTQSTASSSLVRVSPHQLIGHTARVVERQLRALGLRVRLRPQPDFEVPPGTVLTVSPSGLVRPDSLITLTVARATDKHPGHGHDKGKGNGNGNGNGNGKGKD